MVVSQEYDHVTSEDQRMPNGRSPLIDYARPIGAGLLIMVAALVPWLAASQLNARVRPELPWAAIGSLLYLGALLAWLHGVGPPRSTSERRRHRLRLWPPAPSSATDRGALSPGVAIGLLALLTLAWIAIGRLSPIPDLDAFPTTSYRWSMFLMGGVVSGVVEEAAYRGYMQTGLETIDPGRAVVITSLVFALSHINHGIGALLVLGPGLFAAGLLYGTLAKATGTILPGMLIHVAGDLAHTFFGVLRGDAGLLFVR